MMSEAGGVGSLKIVDSQVEGSVACIVKLPLPSGTPSTDGKEEVCSSDVVDLFVVRRGSIGVLFQ